MRGRVKRNQRFVIVDEPDILAQNYVPPPGNIEGRLVTITNNNEFVEAPAFYLPKPPKP